MRSPRNQFPLLVVALTAIWAVAGTGLRLNADPGRADASESGQAKGPPGASVKEDAYKANNIGVAELEQYRYEEAAARFREALKIDPGLSLAHLNLCIALFNEPDLPRSLAEARIAADALPKAP